MEIRIYEITETGFVPCLTTSKAASVTYTVSAFTAGGFEVTFPFGEFGVGEFRLDRLVLIDKHYAGVITDIEYKSDNGADIAVITGYNLLGLLTQHIVLPPNFNGTGTADFDSVAGSAEKCIKYYWNNNVGINAHSKRRIPFVMVGSNLDRGKQNVSYSARFNLLSDVTAELAEAGDLVVTAVLDVINTTIIFDVHNPVDRTFGQQTVSPVVLATDRKTALSMRYSNGLTGSSNAFYATKSGGQFDGATPVQLYKRGNYTGISRRERHLNVSVPDGGDMASQVSHAMTQYEPIHTLTAEINFTRLRYREDFDVGDIITVSNKAWGVTSDLQITSATVTADSSGVSVSVTLGGAKKSMVEILTRNAKNI